MILRILIICALGMFAVMVGWRRLDDWCEGQLNDE